MKVTEITLADGTNFDFADIDNQTISLSALCKSLSRSTRYNGHCNRLFTLSCHSKIVGDLHWNFGDRKTAVFSYIHDCHESLTADLPTPFSASLPLEFKRHIKAAQKRIDYLLYKELGIYEYYLKNQEAIDLEVKKWDQVSLTLESTVLFDQPFIVDAYKNATDQEKQDWFQSVANLIEIGACSHLILEKAIYDALSHFKAQT